MSDERNRMAINPLVIFAGLSVAAVGGIVYVNQIKAPLLDERPVAAKKLTTPLAEPVVKPPEKVASLPPKKAAPDISEKKVKVPEPAANNPAAKKPVAKTPAVKTPAPPAPDLSKLAPIAPSFDVVRIEKDGGAVVVGKAAPNAKVDLILNGKPFGSTKANAKGDWVFIPDKLIPAGDHQLVLESADAKTGTKVRSAQTIVIALSKKKQAKPLVVVASNDAPSKVLQQPQAEAQPVKTPAILKPAAKKTMAEAPAPKAMAKAPETKKTARVEPAAKVTQAVPEITEPPKPVVNNKPVAAKMPLPAKQTLAFGTIDYNDNGNMVFSGTATAGKKIRLYVDNKFVGDTTSDENGKWIFSGRKDIRPGVHQLRADLLSSGGGVARRAAVPFMRADPVKVAALLKTRVKIDVPDTVAAAPAKKAPEKSQPVVTEKTTPAAKTPETVALKKPVSKPAGKPTLKVSAAKPVTPPQPAAKKQSEKMAVAKTPEPEAKKAALPTSVAGKAPEPEKPQQPVSKTVASAPALSPAPTPVIKMARAPEPAGDTEAKKPEKVSHVVIQPGNNLWNISRVIYGKGIAYTTIFQANKEQIKDPDRIYPGQIFDTPGATSSGSIPPGLREPEAKTVQ